MATEIRSTKMVSWPARSIFFTIGAMLATFVALYLILPPSFVLVVVSLVVGLVVALFSVHRGQEGKTAVLLSLALVIVLLSTLVSFLTRPISIGTLADATRALEIDTLLQNNAFSGAVLIAKDRQILLNKGYGYADRSRMTANTPETRFRVGSVTKQFTAMAILILHARGTLNVQDRICEHLSNCPSMWQEITIHHLLTHSSGMRDYWAGCLSSRQQVQEILLKEEKQPLAFTPGARFSYSNLGYRALAEIIEKVSGQSYGEFLQENIFLPIRMTRTAFEPGQAPGLAVGYTNGFLPVCPADISSVHGEGGINSTVEDLYLWDRALETDLLISRPLLDAMFTVHVPMETSANLFGGAGYGWAVGKQWGHFVEMHAGFIYGYTSVIARFPNDRMTVILLSNQQTYDGSIYALLTGKLLEQGEPFGSR